MFNPTRLLLSALATIVAVGSASAQNWPTRPVTMVVPFAAGSSSDTAGRVLAVGLSEALGQQVIIENLGGGGGMTGTARVAKAPPDGYTFVFASVDSMAIVPTMHKRPLYNSVTDFTAAGLVVEQPIVLITRKDLPVNTLPEFVAYAKANHKQDAVRLLRRRLGLAFFLCQAERRARHRSDACALPRLGACDAGPDRRTDRLLLCARRGRDGSARSRQCQSDGAADERTLDAVSEAEDVEGAGIPGVDSYFWTAFFFPKDTPDAIVQKLYEATTQTLKSATTIERLQKAGVAPIAPELRTPAYLKTFIGTEVDNWAAQIKASGVSIE